ASSAPRAFGAKHHSRHGWTGLDFQEPADRTAAADFDVVRMGTQAEHVRHGRTWVAETPRSYGHRIGRRGTSAGLNTSPPRGGLAMLSTTPFPAVKSLSGRLHTCQGGLPLAYRSSSTCLSLKVSMHCQNPEKRCATSCLSTMRRRKGSSTRSSPL